MATLRQSIKKLHFYFGIICLFPLFILALSGILISYYDELAYFIDKPQYQTKEEKTIDELLTKLKENNKTFKLGYINIKKDFIVFLGEEQEKSKEYIFLKNGKEVKELLSSKILDILYAFHFDLGLSLLGYEELGSWIIDISNLLLIFFIVSGIWLYKNDLKKNFRKAMSLNFSFRGLAKFRNLHSALGIWISFILVLICLSGVYYSFSFLMNYVDKFDNSHKRVIAKSEFMDIKYNEIFSKFEEKTNSWLYIYDKDDFRLSIQSGIFSFENYKISKDDKGLILVEDLKANLSDIIYDLHTGYILGRIGQFFWLVVCLSLMVVLFYALKMSFRKIKK